MTAFEALLAAIQAERTRRYEDAGGDYYSKVDAVRELDTLAARVRELQDGDPLLVPFALVWEDEEGDDGLVLGTVANDALENYYVHQVEEPDDFLERLGDAVLRDRAAAMVDTVELMSWATHANPRVALTAIGAMHEWLVDNEEVAVSAGRVNGFSWQRIADYLGRSKQAVWGKYQAS